MFHPCSPHQSDHRAGVTHCVTADLSSLCNPDPLSNTPAKWDQEKEWEMLFPLFRRMSHCTSGNWGNQETQTEGLKWAHNAVSLLDFFFIVILLNWAICSIKFGEARENSTICLKTDWWRRKGGKLKCKHILLLPEIVLWNSIYMLDYFDHSILKGQKPWNKEIFNLHTSYFLNAILTWAPNKSPWK